MSHERGTSDVLRRAMKPAGFVLVAALMVTGILVAPGFDDLEIPEDNPGIWALQSSDGRRFARVNTEIAELDTIKNVSNPSDIVSFGDTVMVYSDNYGSVTALPTGRTVDVDTDLNEDTVPLPAGTSHFAHQGDVVAYLTDGGEVYVGRISDGRAAAPLLVEPYANVEVAEGENRPQFSADAVAVADDGRVLAYSARAELMVLAHVDGANVSETVTVPDGPNRPGVEVTWADQSWVLFDAESGLVWFEGGEEPVPTGALADARLQEPGQFSDEVYIADANGVVRVSLDGGNAQRVHGSSDAMLGSATAPTASPSGFVVAWLPDGTGPGTMWSSNGTVAPLDYGGKELDDDRLPQFRTNGSRLILNESRSGLVWQVPSGELVRSSVSWSPDDDVPIVVAEDEIATRVTEPRAPVAQDNAFGVRPGRHALLPVLLNDYDANGDVLTIVPESVTGLDPDFGVVSVANEDQQLVVKVLPDVTGSASFTYQVTDGTTSDGLVSNTATVTLTASSEESNSPPEWCAVDDCLGTWPSLEVAPGGTVAADVLGAWVDPEGDAIYLESVEVVSGSGSAAASPEGLVVYQHDDSSAASGGTVALEVTVADARGATAVKELSVSIQGESRLEVEPFSITAVVGATITVEVMDHVSGARGPLDVTQVSLGPTDDAEVSLLQGVEGFGFTSPSAGNYFATFTVSDGEAETEAWVRVNVIEPEDAAVSTVPLTAFVRAGEDSTMDVLAAATNPAGSVLMLSDVQVEPAEGAVLSVDVVGNGLLRVSGSTADGSAGTVGVVSYLATDGTESATGQSRGELTVVLLGGQIPSVPVAVDDSISVRVGTQADIRVLDNDVAPAGHVIALDPASVEADEVAGLVFPSGRTIRYLAPSQPGVYTVTYSTYVLGYPQQSDTASLVVTVLDTDSNAPPQPLDLTARVVSGGTVEIPFVGTGIDPDGDAVTLKQVESQPDGGSASIAADGNSLIFSSLIGFSGQTSFTFSVIDGRGEEAVATARVGVLDAELDPSPITYSDYVQAQVGSDARVVIAPLNNDIDPRGGSLELVSVDPDAREGTAEYDDLEEHILDHDDVRLSLAVGEEPGTYSYLYTAKNDRGSTAMGRIILKAVREPVADVPIVGDVLLDAESRTNFATGVDVVSDNVLWTSGDPSGLTLSLWGNQPGVSVSGGSISGTLQEEAQLIPFQLSGENFNGEETSGYGFLRVPGEAEFRIALRSSFEPLQVVEPEYVDFDLIDIVTRPAGATMEIDPESVRATGSRSEASCEILSGTTLRYTAGRGDPYSDACVVSVKLDFQDQYTVLPVPIEIIPEEPQPRVAGASLTVPPGQSAEFDLTQMVEWEPGAQSRDVTFEHGFAGNQFEVTRSGATVSVRANDAAVPGRSEAVTVRLPSDPETPAGTLTLLVGPAPAELPKGATVVQQCSQAQGSSCTIQVIGRAGEVNPIPTTPLVLESVDQPSGCDQVRFEVTSPNTVTATWTQDAPGAVCSASFTATDVQGRVTRSDRVGSVSLDLQGFPVAPAEITQVGYDDGTVTLGVTPGPAARAYPSIEGFNVYRGNSLVTTCSTSGRCSELTGLRNGDQQQYTVRSVNSVGESRDTKQTTAWAYAPPATPTVTAKPAVTGNGEGKRVSLEFRGIDSTTEHLELTSPDGETRQVRVRNQSTLTVSDYLIGTNEASSVTATPSTRLPLPPISGASATGGAVTVKVNGIGKPTITNVSVAYNADATQATLTVNTTRNGDGATTRVGIRQGSNCVSMVDAVGGVATLTLDTTPYQPEHKQVCANNYLETTPFGWADTEETFLDPWADPGAPVIEGGYVLTNHCQYVGDNHCRNRIGQGYNDQPQVAPFQGLGSPEVYYFIPGKENPTKWIDFVPSGSVSGITARYCDISPTTGRPRCSADSTPVGARRDDRSYVVEIKDVACVVGSTPTIDVNASSTDYNVQWRRHVGQNGSGGSTNSATEMRSARAIVTFTGSLRAVNNWTSGWVNCTGVPPDPPDEPDDPEPSPTPTPEPSPEP